MSNVGNMGNIDKHVRRVGWDLRFLGEFITKSYDEGNLKTEVYKSLSHYQHEMALSISEAEGAIDSLKTSLLGPTEMQMRYASSPVSLPFYRPEDPVINGLAKVNAERMKQVADMLEASDCVLMMSNRHLVTSQDDGLRRGNMSMIWFYEENKTHHEAGIYKMYFPNYYDEIFVCGNSITSWPASANLLAQECGFDNAREMEGFLANEEVWGRSMGLLAFTSDLAYVNTPPARLSDVAGRWRVAAANANRLREEAKSAGEIEDDSNNIEEEMR